MPCPPLVPMPGVSVITPSNSTATLLFLASPLVHSLSSLHCSSSQPPHPQSHCWPQRLLLILKHTGACSTCWPRDAPPPHDPTAPWGSGQPGLGLATLDSACTSWCLSCISGFTAVLGSQHVRKLTTCHWTRRANVAKRSAEEGTGELAEVWPGTALPKLSFTNGSYAPNAHPMPGWDRGEIKHRVFS